MILVSKILSDYCFQNMIIVSRTLPKISRQQFCHEIREFPIKAGLCQFIASTASPPPHFDFLPMDSNL